MATEGCSVMKEFYKLLRKADRLFDGQVEFVLDDGEKVSENEEEENDDENLVFFFFVTPKEGPYRNARVKFQMRVDGTQYPDVAPNINCRNSIYHPNIDYIINESDASICVNLLDSDWEPEVGLDGAIMAVLFLFYNPQLDDALSPVTEGYEDYDVFLKNVRQSLKGEDVDGYSFDRLLKEGAEKEEEDNEEEEVKKDATITTTTDTDTTTNTTTTTSSPANIISGEKKEGGGAGIIVSDTTVTKIEIVENEDVTQTATNVEGAEQPTESLSTTTTTETTTTREEATENPPVSTTTVTSTVTRVEIAEKPPTSSITTPTASTITKVEATEKPPTSTTTATSTVITSVETTEKPATAAISTSENKDHNLSQPTTHESTDVTAASTPSTTTPVVPYSYNYNYDGHASSANIVKTVFRSCYTKLKVRLSRLRTSFLKRP